MTAALRSVPWRGFSREPAVRGIGDGLLETLEPLVYVDEIHIPAFRVHVPAGFVSDGASVPRWGWPLLRAGFMALLPPGLLHDYLSRILARIVVAGELVPVPGKLWAARVMAESMRTRHGITAADAKKVQLAVSVAPGYWQRRAVGWRP